MAPVTKAGRYGRYARLTMYLNIVLSPAMTFGLVGMNIRAADAALIGGLNVGQTVICVLLVRAGSAGRPRPTSSVWSFLPRSHPTKADRAPRGCV